MDIGDKVKVINPNRVFSTGKLGLITDIHEHSRTVYRVEFGGDITWSYFEDELEKVEEESGSTNG